MRSLIQRVEYEPVFAKLEGKYACSLSGQPIIFASRVYAVHWLVFAGVTFEETDQLEFEVAGCVEGNDPLG